MYMYMCDGTSSNIFICTYVLKTIHYIQYIEKTLPDPSRYC